MKTQRVLLMLAACTVIAASFGHVEKTEPSRVVGESEIHEAVALAEAYMALSKRANPSDYRLIGAKNLFHKGINVWLVTFKPADLIPSDPAKEAVGAGGELFVTVDLETRKCTVTFGE